VLGHESLRAEPFAGDTLRFLRLSRLDHVAIAAAHLGTSANQGIPRWWTPHLLDQSFLAGSRSLLNHADEAVRRAVVRAMDDWRESGR
jgi:hypothetical protein